MAKKIIRLNESMLKSLIRKMVTEGLNSLSSDVDLDTFSMLADRYEKYAQELRRFVEEFKVFEGTLFKVAKKYNLTLISSDIDNGFEYEGENSFTANYRFGLNGVDIDALYNGDDEAYEEHQRRMDDIANNMEYEIGPRHYNALRISIKSDDYLEVICEFSLWE